MAQPFILPVSLFQKTSLCKHVEQQVNEFQNTWHRSARHCLPLIRLYKKSDQQRREALLRQFITQIQTEDVANRIEEKSVQKDLFAKVHSLFRSGLDIDAPSLDLILSPDCKASTELFIRKARTFDALLSSADLFQACRNVWIMNGLQLMLNLPVRLTDSMLAYSLLYPYTDNYVMITNPLPVKQQFNNRFAQRLAGFRFFALNQHEEKIYTLVEMIESEYDRRQFPRVFESLLAIHQAQTKSVLLLQSDLLPEDQILRISLEKGGTSVVADGYLVAGNLSYDQERFMFGYGAYLQLLDDLQDVNQDAQSGQQSLFTLESEHTGLDAITTQTFNFGETVLSKDYGFPGKDTPMYVQLMQISIQLMLLEAAGFACDRFTAPYVRTLKPFAVSFFSVAGHEIQARPVLRITVRQIDLIVLKKTLRI
ncbi:MAG: hypothetical protein U5R06_18230 [candidate division KSB1 bacterium]|nr:hypothetical protein [candidate division KSB1 bacterium]